MAGANPSNSTSDPRVIWEDGMWAIIEAKDYPPGIGRSKSRDLLGDAIASNWEPALLTPPGAKSIAAKQLVKVKLAEFWATSPTGQGTPKIIGKGLLNPADFAQPVAPPSPFLPKPYKGKDIPEYPHKCPGCGGRFYMGATQIVHESTDPRKGLGDGKCPGPPQTTSGNLPKRARP